MLASLAIASAFLAAFAASAADAVFIRLSAKEKPNESTLLTCGAVFSNAENIYTTSFANTRAHGKDGRQLRMRGGGLKQGFSGLIDALTISVNGISSRALQLERDRVREWSGKDGERGIAFVLNFDGVWVETRLSMKPESPVLWGEVALAPGTRPLSPVTNAMVRVTAIPSFLDSGKGRATRFNKYARQVRTATRLLALPPGRIEKIMPDDRFFVLQDGEYDGSADDRGMGPCATWPLLPTPGGIALNDGWTTSVEYSPDLSRPFRFALLEYKSRRVSNEDFAKSMASIFTLLQRQLGHDLPACEPLGPSRTRRDGMRQKRKTTRPTT